METFSVFFIATIGRVTRSKAALDSQHLPQRVPSPPVTTPEEQVCETEVSANRSESRMPPMEGVTPATPNSGLTFGQFAPKTLKSFSGADGRDFATWFRSFEDMARMVNPPLPDQIKTNTFVGHLEGEARDLVDEMPDEDKNDYAKIVELLRNHFESPHFRSLARQQLCDCKQNPTESARDFAERLKQIVKKVTRGQPRNTQRERLLDEYVDRLKPSLRFHVKAANPPTFDEAVIKAVMYESLLADAANSLSIFPGTQPAIPAVNVLSATARDRSSAPRFFRRRGTTGESPYFLMFGRDPVFTIDRILQPQSRPQIPGASETDEYKAQLVSALRLAWQQAADHARSQELKEAHFPKCP
ncbi:unnamed protein product [Heligmosomoides polygyrus]|uniref:Retrotrans_gag domain-containing protein n=1 Tax=Heligmosomoides polygyrus TaxID=6339 RepID=A0A183FI18_HELPZ|nr:unnamed protein product [Heligmosomoides polygyrus]